MGIAFAAVFPAPEHLKEFTLDDKGRFTLVYDQVNESTDQGVTYRFQAKVIGTIKEGEVTIESGVEGVVEKKDWEKEVAAKVPKAVAWLFPNKIEIPVTRVRELEDGIEVVGRVLKVCEVPQKISSETLLQKQMQQKQKQILGE